MDQETFSRHLLRASDEAYEFASRFVFNPLPRSYRYFVCLNQSLDGNPLELGEHTFPGDIVQYGERIGPIADEEVISLLWRDGRVPEWIDVIPERADTMHTSFRLDCCGRFTDRLELLYYRDTERPPFGCKSPRLPPRWTEADGPFDLHWQLSGDRANR